MTAYGTGAQYDTVGQESALRLLATRCTSGRVAAQAAEALRVAAPAARQVRLDRLIPQALRVQSWSPSERAALVEAMWTAGPGDVAVPPQRRTERLQVRVTPDELEALSARAAHAQMDLSSWVRQRCGL